MPSSKQSYAADCASLMQLGLIEARGGGGGNSLARADKNKGQQQQQQRRAVPRGWRTV